MNPSVTDTTPASAACCPILDEALDDTDAEAAARVFKALADPARVRLLSLIAASPGGEACVCNLVPPLGLSQPTVTHHLKVLSGAGLVQREKRGTFAWYRLDRAALAAASRALQPPRPDR